MFEIQNVRLIFRKTVAPCIKPSAFIVCLSTALSFNPAFAVTAERLNPGWAPASSERLVKLPVTYLKKTVDRDFANSSLAQAFYRNQDRVKLKIETLQDLQTSISRTNDDALRIELRHQFLAEKQAYLELVAEDQKFRRTRAKTQITLYEKLLKQQHRKNGSLSPQKAKLLSKQAEAASRFNASVVNIDTNLFRFSNFGESRYARDYAKNANAIARLVEAINKHPVTRLKKTLPAGMGRSEYIRQLITENEVKLAILDQEKELWGYMAKVVSLDARSLAESLPGTFKNQGSDPAIDNTPSGAIKFFVN